MECKIIEQKEYLIVRHIQLTVIINDKTLSISSEWIGDDCQSFIEDETCEWNNLTEEEKKLVELTINEFQPD